MNVVSENQHNCNNVFEPVGWTIHESWANFAREHAETFNDIYEKIKADNFYPSAGNVLRFMECDITKI